MLELPRLYVITDLETLARHGMGLAEFAGELRKAGILLVQLRAKGRPRHEVLEAAAVLKERLPGATLLLNDFVDLVEQVGFDGAHVGQSDMEVTSARAVLGGGAVVGVSTHLEAQVADADRTSADYVAVGPVFLTSTKADAAPVVGLEGVRRARALTTRPLVAIGGITRANCRAVIDAGADSVAVISALFAEGETVEEVARDFLRILR